MSEKGSHSAIAIVGASLFFGIFLPVSCYFCFVFFRLRKTRLFKLRYGWLTILSVVSILINYILSGLNLLHIGGYINTSFEAGTFFCMFVFSYAIFQRFWLIYYDIEIIHLTENEEWKSLIDDKMDDNYRNDWFLINKETYGNNKYLLKFSIPIIIIAGIIFPIIFGIVSSVDNLSGILRLLLWIIYGIWVILFLVPLIGIAGITSYMQEFQDELFVLDELSWIMKGSWAIMIVFILLFISIALNSIINNLNVRNIIAILIEILFGIVTFGFIYASTYRAARKLLTNKITLPKNRGGRRISGNEPSITLFSGSSKTESTKPSNNEIKKVNEKYRLEFILSHGESFDLFMIHLQKEFQIEVLLSFVEFLQFRQHVERICFTNKDLDRREEEQKAHKKKYNNGGSSNNVQKSDKERNRGLSQHFRSANQTQAGWELISLPPTVPKSEIVHSAVPDNVLDDYSEITKIPQEILEFKHKAHKLFGKYIKAGQAKFEINIAYHYRRELTSKFDNYDELMRKDKMFTAVSILHVFDKCLDEQWKYCSNSLGRFKHTNDFKKIVSFFDKDQ